MLKHIVLFKLKGSAEGATREENAKKVKEMLEALRGRIPQIRHLEVGINCLPAETAYDVAIYSEFEDENALDGYMKHPEHIKAAEFIGNVREARAVVDYRT